LARGRVVLLLGALALLCSRTTKAQDAAPLADSELRDPLEIRDEHVLAQGRLTLPATGADPVGKGVTRLRLSFLWGNSFSWTQEGAGEAPTDRRFLIDGETRTLDLTVTRGLADDADLTLRVPLRWRGGGSLDGFIDAWHRRFAFLGIPDGDRPLFLKDAFRVEGVTTQGEPFSWNDATGSGLGNLELASRWRFHRGRSSASLVARLSLPTASLPYEAAWGGGTQLVLRRPLATSLDLHAGVGGTIEGHRRVRGITYEQARLQAYLALAYRPWPRLSLTVETDVANRLVADIDRYPGLHWLINGGVKVAATRKLVVELGLTENLKDQLCTTDFAAYVAISVRP
jgi:hypothetical protein